MPLVALGFCRLSQQMLLCASRANSSPLLPERPQQQRLHRPQKAKKRACMCMCACVFCLSLCCACVCLFVSLAVPVSVPVSEVRQEEIKRGNDGGCVIFHLQGFASDDNLPHLHTNFHNSCQQRIFFRATKEESDRREKRKTQKTNDRSHPALSSVLPALNVVTPKPQEHGKGLPWERPASGHR